MHMTRRHTVIGGLALLLSLGLSAPAWAPTFFNPGSVIFANLGTPSDGATVYCSDCTFGSDPCTGSGTGAMAYRINGSWSCIDSDSGAAAGGLTGVSAQGLVDGASTVYMTAGSGVDTTEVDVEQKVRGSMTLANLQCIASADPGAAETIVVTGRSGACGALSSSGTFTCTLTGGSGRPICDAGANTMSLTPGQCWSLQLTFGSALATSVVVNCTLERSA